jgi:hypothetical protein
MIGPEKLVWTLLIPVMEAEDVYGKMRTSTQVAASPSQLVIFGISVATSAVSLELLHTKSTVKFPAVALFSFTQSLQASQAALP